jgi:predicted nucleic acid-binding protein
VRPDKIYIDTMFLIQWFISVLENKKPPKMIELLSEHEEIEKCISLISVVELKRVLRYNNDFKRYRLEVKRMGQILASLQNMTNLKIIDREKFGEVRINGIIVSYDISRFIEEHDDLVDCIHVDIAKSHELCFLTDDRKIGNLKKIYGNIMTANKFAKQFKP